jgi:hypothetical protein
VYLAARVQDAFHAQYAAVWFVDRKRRELYNPVADKRQAEREPRMPQSAGIAGYVARTGESVVVQAS